MKILFISRCYPPVLGGIEKQNFEIRRSLSKYCELDLIANRLGKFFLPVFLIYALVRSLIIMPRYDLLLLGDGVLAIVGRVLRMIYQVPVVSIVHGLDLTYSNFIYQTLWVRRFIKNMDGLIAVGNETINQGVQRGIPRSKFTFIPNGVETRSVLPRYSRSDLSAIAGSQIDGKVLLTVGRLVERKGILWFIENVMINLPKNVTYIVAGKGGQREKLLSSIAQHGLEKRVLYLGSVSDKTKEILFCTADVFVQPNIAVEGDIEGFGLVVLEAASFGLPVVASEIEGLKDAIHDGKNGFLVESGNANAFISKIEYLLMEDERRKRFGLEFREYVEENFSWENTAREYVKSFENFIGSCR